MLSGALAARERVLRLDRPALLISTGLGIVVLAVAVAALGLRAYLGRAAESRLRPDEVIDFAARASAGRSNVFAACPSGYCTPRGDLASPIFAMDWQRLRDHWQAMIAAQPRVETITWDEQRRRATYIQRSSLFRFPDIVTVAFVEIGEGRSSLAIDSRSRYGKSDLGVNRERVIAWLAMLQAMLPAGQGAVADDDP
jgi:uncharacterized protein (DUF1499 family)